MNSEILKKLNVAVVATVNGETKAVHDREEYTPSELGALVTELEESEKILQGIESDPYEGFPGWLKANALSQEQRLQSEIETQLVEISYWENKLQA